MPLIRLSCKSLVLWMNFTLMNCSFRAIPARTCSKRRTGLFTVKPSSVRLQSTGRTTANGCNPKDKKLKMRGSWMTLRITARAPPAGHLQDKELSYSTFNNDQTVCHKFSLMTWMFIRKSEIKVIFFRVLKSKVTQVLKCLKMNALCRLIWPTAFQMRFFFIFSCVHSKNWLSPDLLWLQEGVNRQYDSHQTASKRETKYMWFNTIPETNRFKSRHSVSLSCQAHSQLSVLRNCLIS